jgi:C-terminal processing protease CtpA/Prc
VRTFEAGDVERVVLDLRLNGGGDNTTFGPLIQAIQESPDLNRRGKLYALISRHTFSAAGNFITVLQRDTEAILVGQPTGGAPNQYGDARMLTLPHVPWLRVSIATRYHVFGIDGDERVTHEPELMVPLTAADYFSRSDRVLETALNDRPDAR